MPAQDDVGHLNRQSIARTACMAEPPGGKQAPDFEDSSLAKYTMSVTVKLTTARAYQIRRFERFGLLAPARTDAGQRLFSDWEIALIRDIAGLMREGINMAGVRMIMAMRRGKVE